MSAFLSLFCIRTLGALARGVSGLVGYHRISCADLSLSLILACCVIALAIKGIEYEYRAISLIKDGGQQV